MGREIESSRRAAALTLVSSIVVACAGTISQKPVPTGASEIADEPSATPTDEPVASVMTSSSAVASVSASVRPVDTRPRIVSTAYMSWIHALPSKESSQIGWVRVGSSVPMKSAEPVKGAGCPGGWFALDPIGFVCDDATLTRDVDDPYVKALAIARPGFDQPMPYRYALSGGAPMYARLPTAEEQLKIEGPPEKRPAPPRMLKWAQGHEELANIEGGVAASDEIPEVFRDHHKPPGAQGLTENRLVKKWIPVGSMLSFRQAFAFGGRTWLVSPDLSVVPADRVRLFKTSTFHGVELRDGVSLPIGWSRHDPVKKLRKTATGFEPTGEVWAPRTPVQLKERIEQEGRAYWSTREGELFVAEADVGIAQQAEKLPTTLPEGSRWIEVRGAAGTLVAYDGLKPVYATLMSTGMGGVGYGDNALQVKNSTTPVGLYRIQSKERSATMSPEKGDPREFWISDVPYTQYFRAPFAIHVAYWHEDFGMPKSAGCVNVSPEDGRWLFSWTDPVAIPEWAATVPAKASTGLGTWVYVAK